MNNNLRDLKKFKVLGMKKLGLKYMLPEMGPFPLSDSWGMSIVVVLVQRKNESMRTLCNFRQLGG